MFPILLKVGFVTIHTYGLMVAMGFLVGYTNAKRQFDFYHLPLSLLDQLVMLVMVSGIFGARLFYLWTEGFMSLRQDPMLFFRVWEGGLVYFGGFLGAVFSLTIFSYRKKIPFTVLGDALVGPLLLAQALGRLGCLAAGCCFGKPTQLPWAVGYSHPASLAPSGVLLHPTQLYEALAMVVLFFIWMLIQPRSKKWGAGLGIGFYLIGYGSVRFIIELFRGDFRGPSPWGLFPSQWLSFAAIIIGVGLLIRLIERSRVGKSN